MCVAMNRYERYLLRYSLWSLARSGREKFDDRLSEGLFGKRIAERFQRLRLIKPWGTMRCGEPAYNLTPLGYLVARFI
jgi:hypothetical protein